MRTRSRNMAVVLAAMAPALAFAAPAARAQDACADAAADTLNVGFYDDFIPVSYSAEKDSTGGPGEHRGYEADLLTAFEAMGGVALVRHPIGGAFGGVWLRAAGPRYDLVGGGITVRDDRTRDASGRRAVAFTAGHIAFPQTLLVRAGDADRLAGYDALGPDTRVALVPGTTGEERLLQLTGYIDSEGRLRRGTRVHAAAGVVEADGTARYAISAAGASASVAGRRRLEPPAGARDLPRILYFEKEADQLAALRDGAADAVARGLIGNSDAAAESGGALVISARDSRVEYGGFAVAAEDTALLACLDERLDYLTDSRRIGYERWRADPSVFLRRADAWTGRGGPVSTRNEAARRSILPEVARELSAVAAEAVGERVETAFTGGAATGAALPSTLAAALRAAARERGRGASALARAFDGSSFTLALDSGADAPGGAGAAFWGGGDYRRLSGGGGGAPEWDGGIANALVGADARPRPDMLAGLAVSFSRGSFDFRGGGYEMRMTAAHPYVGWTSASGETGLWATAGHGRGEAEIADDASGRRTSNDLSLAALAVGGRRTLASSPDAIAGGATTLKLKAQASGARVKSANADALLDALAVNAWRARAALAAAHERALDGGGRLSPSLEAGLRHDGGDGSTGAGAEIAGALRYRAPEAGLTLSARARWLAAHRASREEWSVGGAIRLEPGAGGRGWSFVLAPAFGDEPAAGAWRRGGGGARLDAALGYGVSALGGVLTPHAALRAVGRGAGEARLGGRFAFGSAFTASLEAARRATAAGAPDNSLALRGALRF